MTAINNTINYNDSLPVLEYSISGFMDDDQKDDLDIAPSIEVIGSSKLLPGAYSIVVSGGYAKNYDFEYKNGTLIVNPREVMMITVEDSIFYYNGEEQNISVYTIPEKISWNIKYLNSNGEELHAPINAGAYFYVVTINEEGYRADSLSGNIFVRKADLKITADTIKLTYGDSIPNIHFNYTGFKDTDSTNVLYNLPKIDSLEGWPWNTGKYSLAISPVGSMNYNTLCDSVTLLIESAELIVTPKDTVITYGDSLSYYEYSIYGFRNDEDLSVLTTFPTIYSDSVYPLNPGLYTLYGTGAEAENYTFLYQTGILKIEPIGVAEISLSDTIISYDGKSHILEATVYPSGLNHQINYIETPIIAGDYQITATITEPGYFSVTDSAILTIEKAKLTATVTDTSILIGEELPEFKFELTGFVNNETIEVIDQLPKITLPDSRPMLAGTYTIMLSGGLAKNYSFTYKSGTFTLLQSYLLKFFSDEHGKILVGEDTTPLDSVWHRIAAFEDSPLFHAIPNEGYVFKNWSNGSTQNPLIISNVSVDTTIVANFEVITGIVQSSNVMQFQVYPNPVNSNQGFNIVVDKNNSTTSLCDIVISDLLGRKISYLEQLPGSYYHEGLHRGIYFVTLLVDGIPAKTLKLLVK